MIEGIELKIGESTYTVPPLNFAGLKKVAPKLQGISVALAQGKLGAFTEEQTDAILEVVLVALKRNYPDLTREKIEEDLDLANMGAVISAVMNISGIKKNPTPEQKKAMKTSVGETSTPSSLPAQAGPGNT